MSREIKLICQRCKRNTTTVIVPTYGSKVCMDCHFTILFNRLFEYTQEERDKQLAELWPKAYPEKIITKVISIHIPITPLCKIIYGYCKK
jgi:hypothetical protein